MFHQRLNELRLALRLMPRSPLLVKAGEDPDALLPPEQGRAPGDESDFAGLYATATRKIKDRAKQIEQDRQRRKQARVPANADERTHATLLREKLDLDMRFVVTRRNGADEPYLPGSGLKGVLRSRAEQWARTFLSPTERVCDIFNEDAAAGVLQSCTKTVEALPATKRYQQACRICQIFGCGGLAGRFSVSDAYLCTAATYGVRSGVGIDRGRGAAHEGALFFYQVLDGGAFDVTLTLENFELWQAGLLAHTLQALFAGELPVGFGTRRGLGRMQGQMREATLTYFGTDAHQAPAGCELRGVAALAGAAAGQTYGFRPELPPTAPLAGATLTARGLRQEWRLPPASLDALWAEAAQAWAQLCASNQEASR